MLSLQCKDIRRAHTIYRQVKYLQFHSISESWVENIPDFFLFLICSSQEMVFLLSYLFLILGHIKAFNSIFFSQLWFKIHEYIFRSKLFSLPSPEHSFSEDSYILLTGTPNKIFLSFQPTSTFLRYHFLVPYLDTHPHYLSTFFCFLESTSLRQTPIWLITLTSSLKAFLSGILYQHTSLGVERNCILYYYNFCSNIHILEILYSYTFSHIFFNSLKPPLNHSPMVSV